MKLGPNNQWTEEQNTILRDVWPNFGTRHSCEKLGLRPAQVRGQVVKLGLRMKPKHQRRCIGCETGHQVSRTCGLRCCKCFLSHRVKVYRSHRNSSSKIWLSHFLWSKRCRSRKVKMGCELTIEYLEYLWERQGGRCYYTGIELSPPIAGTGRNMMSASLNRLDSSKGYVKRNVVWCCWACNLGKSDMSMDQYVHICKMVVDRLG